VLRLLRGLARADPAGQPLQEGAGNQFEDAHGLGAAAGECDGAFCAELPK
jgi:hypothetical protein